MNLVSLLILPAIFSDSLVDKKPGDSALGTLATAEPTGTAKLIALGALVVLVISIAYSKRKKSGFGIDVPATVPHTEAAEVVEEILVSPAVPATATATATKARKAPAKKAAAKKTVVTKATTKRAAPARKATKATKKR
jgi:hypothetical protein